MNNSRLAAVVVLVGALAILSITPGQPKGDLTGLFTAVAIPSAPQAPTVPPRPFLRLSQPLEYMTATPTPPKSTVQFNPQLAPALEVIIAGSIAISSGSVPAQPQVPQPTQPEAQSPTPTAPPASTPPATPPQTEAPPSSSEEPPAQADNFPQPSPTNLEPVGDWWSEIVSVCHDKWGLDPYLIAALVKIESWFDETAYNAGERQAYESGYRDWYGSYYGKGLMQVTGPWVGGVPLPRESEYSANIPPEARRSEAPVMYDAYNGRQNLDRGCWYFKALVNRYNGNEWKAVAAYKHGWFGVDDGRFNEFSSYTQQVKRYYEAYLATVNK